VALAPAGPAAGVLFARWRAAQRGEHAADLAGRGDDRACGGAWLAVACQAGTGNGEVGQGEHGQGDVPVPAVVALVPRNASRTRPSTSHTKCACRVTGQKITGWPGRRALSWPDGEGHAERQARKARGAPPPKDIGG
jgi:hypothetical protein